jgi:hypothetical protein
VAAADASHSRASSVNAPATPTAVAAPVISSSKGWWGARITSLHQALFPSFPPDEEAGYVRYLGEASRPYCMVWLLVALTSSSIIIAK